MRVAAALVLFASMVLAGCGAPAEDGAPAPATLRALPLLAPPDERAFWIDAMHAPHPAYGWPTLTHVPPEAPAWWHPPPARAVPADASGFVPLAHVDAEGGAGDGMVVFGRLAILPGFGGGPVEVHDIGDPERPTLLASFTPEMPRRDADLIPYPDGRLVLALTSDSGYVLLYDLTDPAAPVELTPLALPTGGHTVSVVPGTPILYNANSLGSYLVYPPYELAGGASRHQTEIYDLSDPENPVLVDEWQNGYGCHIITFQIDAKADRHRAYCAAVDGTQIWDIADPLRPSVVSTFPMPHAQRPAPGVLALATAHSHSALVNHAGTVLAISEETLGGLLPACGARASAGPAGEVSGPTANVWFYDIRDEANPRLLGRIAAESPALAGGFDRALDSCAGHVGRLVPHGTRDLIAVTFLAGGMLLIDFTEPTEPVVLDTWRDGAPSDVWYVNGYLVAGGLEEGLDVLGLR